MTFLRFAVPVAVPVVALGLTAAALGVLDREGSADVTAAPVVVEVGQVVSVDDVEPSGVTADPAWVADTASRAGVPVRALQAYASAALRLGAEQPACRLGWTTLSAIGQIESGHGGDLDADGRSSDTIHGPSLDGSGDLAAIEGAEGWDRARGPMQFIASTWTAWAADGDDDGASDVDDIDDAAYAAGRYLCAAGGDLSTAPGWTRAVHAYNHSDEYVRAVLATADVYAARTR